MRIGPLWVLVVFAAAIGCAARKPAQAEPAPPVGTSQIDDFQPPPSDSRRAGEERPPRVFPPRPLDRTLPTYPESALPNAVACVARILYHVETSGHATLVQLEWVEPPPAEYVTDFEEAIRTGVSEWRYWPAVRVVPERQADGSIEPVRTPVPRAQHALIRFRVEDGKAVVE